MGATAGVTSCSPVEAVAPATSSCASCPLSTTCWFESATTCAEFFGRLLICLPIMVVWCPSWFSAVVRLLIAVSVDHETNALA